MPREKCQLVPFFPIFPLPPKKLVNPGQPSLTVAEESDLFGPIAMIGPLSGGRIRFANWSLMNSVLSSTQLAALFEPLLK